MAERLTTRDYKYDRAFLLEKLDQYDAITAEQVEAKANVSSIARRITGLRRELTGKGINLAEFDRMRANRALSGGERERAEHEYARMMAFIGKPLGFQSGFDFDEELGEENGKAAFTVHELKTIDNAGFDAGLKGHERHGSNTWTVGTEAYQRFDAAWIRGNEQRLAAEELESTPDQGDPPPAAEKRGRGRPPKTAETTVVALH